MNNSQHKTVNFINTSKNQEVIKCVTTWLNQSQYDKIFDLLHHKFSPNILLVVNEIHDQILQHFDGLREEFLHSAGNVMATHIGKHTGPLDDLNELKKLRSLIHTLYKMMCTLSLKIEQNIDNEDIINANLTNIYKLILSTRDSFEFFYRYSSMMTIFYDRYYDYITIMSKTNCAIHNKLFIVWNRCYNQNSKNGTHKLHIDYLVKKLNDELKQVEGSKERPNFFKYPPNSLNDIFTLTLVDTITIDIPKLILIYTLHDLNSFWGNNFLSNKDIDYIADFLKLNKLFKIVLKQLWFCDNRKHNETMVFPFIQNVVLYDKQHLVTLKAYITNNYFDKAINFANRFNFSSMNFQFNSIVIGLLCKMCLYFRIVPFLQCTTEQPEYWHIIIYYSYEMSTLFKYLIQTFFILDNIDTNFVWKFIDYHTQRRSHTKLIEAFSYYMDAYEYIIYIYKRMNHFPLNEKLYVKSLISDYSLKRNSIHPHNDSINVKQILDNSNINYDDEHSNTVNGSTYCTSYLPIQSINDSLGLSMCESLLHKSCDYKKKNIANMLHYSLNNSIQPTSILKRKIHDDQNLSIPILRSKKLKFIIDGVLLSPGRKRSHNLKETFSISSSKNNGNIENSSDDIEFFDALEDINSIGFNNDLNTPPYTAKTTKTTTIGNGSSSILPVVGSSPHILMSTCDDEASTEPLNCSLDNISTNLNETFDKLSPISNFRGNPTDITDAIKPTATTTTTIGQSYLTDICSYSEDLSNYTKNNSIIDIETMTIGSNSLPLPSIIYSGDNPESLALDRNKFENNNSLIVSNCKIGNDFIENPIQKQKPAYRVHRIKHKSMCTHSNEGTISLINNEDDDSPYNSVLEKRSFIRNYEPQCNNELAQPVNITFDIPQYILPQSTDNHILVSYNGCERVDDNEINETTIKLENFPQIGNTNQFDNHQPDASTIQVDESIHCVADNTAELLLNKDVQLTYQCNNGIGLVEKALPTIGENLITPNQNIHEKDTVTRQSFHNDELVGSSIHINEIDYTNNTLNTDDHTDIINISTIDKDFNTEELTKHSGMDINSKKSARVTRKRRKPKQVDHINDIENQSLPHPDKKLKPRNMSNDSYDAAVKTPKNTKIRNKSNTSGKNVVKKNANNSTPRQSVSKRKSNITKPNNNITKLETNVQQLDIDISDYSSPPVRVLRSRTIRKK